jgi:hypothetical protein
MMVRLVSARDYSEYVTDLGGWLYGYSYRFIAFRDGAVFYNNRKALVQRCNECERHFVYLD